MTATATPLRCGHHVARGECAGPVRLYALGHRVVPMCRRDAEAAADIAAMQVPMVHRHDPERAPPGLLRGVRNSCLLEGVGLLLGGVVLVLVLLAAGGIGR